MSRKQLRIYVEGATDAIIVSFLLQAAGVDSNFEIISCGGKQGVAKAISGLQDTEKLRHIALIDSDLLSVPDSKAEAKNQLGVVSIPVFCAVPEVESWLFADDLAIDRFFLNTKRRDFVARLPLPEMIVYPRLLARNIFPRVGPLEAYAFLRDVDVNRAASRSPSLRAFLSGVLESFDRQSLIHVNALETSISRDVLSTLMHELPADTLVWKTVDGNMHTAKQLAKAISEGENIGRQFATELLRIARDDRSKSSKMSDNILFVTAYDAATAANYAMAIRLINSQDYALLGASATGKDLLDAISKVKPGGGIFMMSHGKPQLIKGNDDLPALSEQQGPLVSGRKVFAWACWTGVRMGYYISQCGCDWWGYDCAITAPDERAEFAKIQAEFFHLAKELYVTVQTSSDILPIIESLKNECEKAIKLLDEANAGNDVDAFGIYSTCNQFWQRLMVWHPTTKDYFRHPSAPSVLLQI